MSDSPFHRTADGALDIPLHRQDTDTTCGGACLQMVFGALGFELKDLIQPDLMAAASAPFGGNNECNPARNRWYLCPEAMARNLRIPDSINYVVATSHTSHDIIARVVASCETAGFPCILLVDNGHHWLLAHGVRRNSENRVSLDVRDPAPALPHHGAHVPCPCSHLLGSAEAHLLTPDGIEGRLTPCEKGSLWRNSYLAIIPDRVSDSIPPDPSELNPPPQDSPPDGPGAAALEAFAAAADAGWPPAALGPVVVSDVIVVNDPPHMQQWSGVPPAPYRLVHLKRQNEPKRTAIIVLVAMQLGNHVALELLAPSMGQSWLFADIALSDHARSRVMAMQQPDHPDFHDVPTWLTNANWSEYLVGYVWRSVSFTRSPFHPLVQISSSAGLAWITPAGRLLLP